MKTISPLASNCVEVPASHTAGKRTHRITRITPHCFVGQWRAQVMADYFAATPRQISVNYVIGNDGTIVCVCPEDVHTYCSSSWSNDERAITIEIACDTFYPYAMESKAINALVNLMVDICQRHGLTSVATPGGISGVRDTAPTADWTAHRWFDATECPGDYLYNKRSKIADDVNYQLERSQDNMKIYRTVDDVPPWAKPTIEKLVEKKALQGTEPGVLNISEDLARLFVVHDRLGLYG